jgi:inner membrane protein
LVTFAPMDSITQIVLGAACGEIALGKKIGNKAILFGAIGGTIPDLDVLIGSLYYSNEIDSLAFHRGFMHSIIFAILGAFLFGFISSKAYDYGPLRKGTTNLKDWIWLFFLSIFTHPILDSFTPYGTQLFLPFSDYRVAFNNIAVADPLYTLPFLLCIIIAMFYNRKNPTRRRWTKVGLYLSSAYMIFTIGNKLHVNHIFKKSFQEANINYSKFSAQPTILNNILWYAVAETDTDYKVTFYSIFDKNTRSTNFINIPKNHTLVDINHRDIKTLRWFSNEFYTLSSLNNNQVIYKDLRYPLLDQKDSTSSLFSFELIKEDKRWNTKSLSEERFKDSNMKKLSKELFYRAFRDF